MTASRFIVILMIVVNVFGKHQQTKYNCESPDPQMDENCCLLPSLHLEKYEDTCLNIPTMTGRSHVIACDVACILKASGALYNETFSLPMLKKLLQEIIQNNTEVVEILTMGFKTCVLPIRKIFHEHEKTQPQQFLSRRPCSNIAMLTSACAGLYLYINCPDHIRTNTSFCDETRDHMRNCAFSYVHHGRLKPGSHKGTKGSPKKTITLTSDLVQKLHNSR